jgi:hypothetical protein
MNRRSFLKTTSTADGSAVAGSKLSTLAIGESVQAPNGRPGEVRARDLERTLRRLEEPLPK